jgi:hypothetical protein
MDNTMLDLSLTVTGILRYGASWHADRTVITATADGYREIGFGPLGERVAQLGHGLCSIGVTGDQRVATFKWDNQEHLEAYLAIPPAPSRPRRRALIDHRTHSHGSAPAQGRHRHRRGRAGGSARIGGLCARTATVQRHPDQAATRQQPCHEHRQNDLDHPTVRPVFPKPQARVALLHRERHHRHA